MADMFGRTTASWGGAFRAEDAVITFSGAPKQGAGLLTQRLAVGFRQNARRLFDMHSNTMYYVVGRSEGEMTMDRVVGPSALQAAFYTQYGDPCNANKNDLIIRANTGCMAGGRAGERVTYSMKYCLLVDIGMQITTADMVIGETCRLMVGSMEYKAGSGPTGQPIDRGVNPFNQGLILV